MPNHQSRQSAHILVAQAAAQSAARGPADADAALADGNVESSEEVPQAFSHFTWAASGGKILVCDIQVGPRAAPRLAIPASIRAPPMIFLDSDRRSRPGRPARSKPWPPRPGRARQALGRPRRFRPPSPLLRPEQRPPWFGHPAHAPCRSDAPRVDPELAGQPGGGGGGGGRRERGQAPLFASTGLARAVSDRPGITSVLQPRPPPPSESSPPALRRRAGAGAAVR